MKQLRGEVGAGGYFCGLVRAGTRGFRDHVGLDSGSLAKRKNALGGLDDEQAFHFTRQASLPIGRWEATVYARGKRRVTAD